eukprot:CAMPEP_0171460464 /NCGR_PEP_ID=MMETSP0945-20130129/5324_1 /TAXON_ID=109269 /ORGANISM="Vaucheria litorea, Strain CCMP2940" /LENGTH=242 /DNA_ID=CAMNT_0011986661 /DNA_START=129 /DNA_END=853 /DNA_ORIENTATION=+
MSLNLEVKRRGSETRVNLMDAEESNPKRIRRVLTDEDDVKKYEANIHELLQEFPKLREAGLKEFEETVSLFSIHENARVKRRKVFEFFDRNINEGNRYQNDLVPKIVLEVYGVLEENKEQLHLLSNWCDLCLPSNDTSFAEANRIKIQDFQDYLSTGISLNLASMRDINKCIDERTFRLQLLFSTKPVLEENRRSWAQLHRNFLVFLETNTYIKVTRIWEKVLEDYILYYNYWVTNLKGGSL